MESIKKDLKISILVGFLAGILIIPTLRNIGVSIDVKTGILSVIGLLVFTPSGYLAAVFFSRWFPIMLQIVKFGISGGLSAMIDLGILNSLISLSGIYSGLYFSLFKGISYVVAVTNSYLWNKYWTFSSHSSASSGEFFKFIFANLIGFGFNIGGASLGVNVIGAPAGVSGELWANGGAVSMVFVSMTWNFLSMKFLVFKVGITLFYN